MRKFPEKSNWISYKYNEDGTYIAHNHLIDEDIAMSQDEMDLLDRLNGKVNPYDILQREFGLTHREALNYVDALMSYGVLRQGNRVFGMFSMRTIVKIYNSQRYRELSIVLLGLFMISFIPSLLIGIKSTYKVLFLCEVIHYSPVDGPYWLGFLIGVVVGLFFHELNHAIACCAFGGPVMELGVTFRGFPAAYTMIDESRLSRCGQIITYLAGVQANFMIAAISMCLYYHFGAFPSIFVAVASVNLELALVNLLFIEGLDGCNAISKLLGVSDIYEKCKKYLRKYGMKAESGSVSESEKTVACMYRIFSFSKLIYPLLILFNLCVVWGW